MISTISEPVSFARSSNEFTTPAALQTLLKQSLGYNSRQVTVRKGHSNTWLTITIRDAAVDVQKVKAFAAPFDTSHTDNTDYHSGQSVDVETTREVNAIHGAPFLEEIKSLVGKIEPESGETLSSGKVLWRTSQGFYVTSDGGANRGCYIHEFDVLQGTEWAIAALALQAARV